MADKFQLYLEVESRNADDWNNIRSIVETLNGIDIKPRDEINLQILEDLEEGNTSSYTLFDSKSICRSMCFQGIVALESVCRQRTT